MLPLIQRNFTLFFRKRAGVFFSVLGALISFVLFIIFLKNNMLHSWSQLENPAKMLDLWVIGGTLAVTSMTATLNSISQMVADIEKNVYDDIRLTGITNSKIQFSYIISATIIGTVMQIILFIVMAIYFKHIDNLNISGALYGKLLGIAILAAFVGSVLNYILIYFMKSIDTVGKLSSIVGAMSGFLVGTYIPVGILPTFAQNLVKITPGAYAAALYRQLLMHDSLNNVTGALAIKKELGVGLVLNGHLTTISQNAMILMGILIVLLLISLFMSTEGFYKKIKLRME
ncbi:ABC transporter permease [Ligilactobacillus sp. WILCCON 0076]|uniref:ABC transporter permease n=1 Tax=Ligilactobacillus ubinensis TaxID=2876789 RepID=A0A9X2JKB6_9LACO|nr:ABC transporter permease [Ligilactobacillus ubinensis]MCP0886107.1 ABC transporter permease [Ligilactobacillus ubinensis]